MDKIKNTMSDVSKNTQYHIGKTLDDIHARANKALRDPVFYGSLGASAAVGLGAYALKKYLDKKKAKKNGK